MAVAAQWHIHVVSTNHRLAILARGAERETRILLAQFANRGQLFNFLALRDQSQDGREGTPHESPLQ